MNLHGWHVRILVPDANSRRFRRILSTCIHAGNVAIGHDYMDIGVRATHSYMDNGMNPLHFLIGLAMGQNGSVQQTI